MAISTLIKSSTNKLLRKFNLKIDTLTSEELERTRLEHIAELKHFANPVFPIPKSFYSQNYHSILEQIKLLENNLNNLKASSNNSVNYSYLNHYFTSPDAEVLYALIYENRPQKIIEIGCGNSTKIIRQSLRDSLQSNTKLISIDPCPRTEIIDLTDELYLRPVEDMDLDIFRSLKSGDVLFIDSSHTVKAGNDVAFLYTKVIPELQPGVMIHIHDIFLPYDYPKQWVIDEQWGWNEQYLVQCMLQMSDAFEVLWAGHFIQKTFPNFQQYFPNVGNNLAQSLWLQKIR